MFPSSKVMLPSSKVTFEVNQRCFEVQKGCFQLHNFKLRIRIQLDCCVCKLIILFGVINVSKICFQIDFNQWTVFTMMFTSETASPDELLSMCHFQCSIIQGHARSREGHREDTRKCMLIHDGKQYSSFYDRDRCCLQNQDFNWLYTVY